MIKQFDNYEIRMNIYKYLFLRTLQVTASELFLEMTQLSPSLSERERNGGCELRERGRERREDVT